MARPKYIFVIAWVVHIAVWLYHFGSNSIKTHIEKRCFLYSNSSGTLIVLCQCFLIIFFHVECYWMVILIWMPALLTPNTKQSNTQMIRHRPPPPLSPRTTYNFTILLLLSLVRYIAISENVKWFNGICHSFPSALRQSPTAVWFYWAMKMGNCAENIPSALVFNVKLNL